MNATEIFLYGTAWTAIWGLIVWFGKDKISNYRERQTRKQHFLAYINVWQSEVAHEMGQVVFIPNLPGVTVFKGLDKMAREFNATLSPFIERATVLELNYRHKKLRCFQSLVRNITQMTAGQIDTEEGKKELLAALRDLSAFVRKN